MNPIMESNGQEIGHDMEHTGAIWGLLGVAIVDTKHPE